MLPIGVVIIAVATPILAREGYRIKERFEEKLTDNELDKIEPVLYELGLTPDQISYLDTEKEVSEMVKAQLNQLDRTRQVEIMHFLRDCLDRDECFEIEPINY